MRNLTELYRMDLPHRAISVYIYLADRAGKKNTCWPSIPTIAKDLKLSERIYRCTCGSELDRDVNAAINICEEGRRILMARSCA